MNGPPPALNSEAHFDLSPPPQGHHLKEESQLRGAQHHQQRRPEDSKKACTLQPHRHSRQTQDWTAESYVGQLSERRIQEILRDVLKLPCRPAAKKPLLTKVWRRRDWHFATNTSTGPRSKGPTRCLAMRVCLSASDQLLTKFVCGQQQQIQSMLHCEISAPGDGVGLFYRCKWTRSLCNMYIIVKYIFFNHFHSVLFVLNNLNSNWWQLLPRRQVLSRWL